jgi:dipeptidyl aminopeptidase/acylaminoacyl peptidase
MKKIIILSLIFFVFTSIQAKEIPLKDFAQKSQINNIKISPNGKHLAYTYEDETEIKLGIMDIKNKKGVFTFDVGKEREVSQYWWVNDERILVLASNITGWLDGARKDPILFAVDIDGKKRVNLWLYQMASLSMVSLLEDDPKNVLMLKRHYTDKGEGNLVKLNVYTGKTIYVDDSPKPVGESRDSVIYSIDVDLNEKPRIAFEYDPKDRNNFDDDTVNLHYKDFNQEWHHLELPKVKKKVPVVSFIGIHKNNGILYFVSDHDLEDGGTLGLFSFNIETQKIDKLFRHPDVDIAGSVVGSEGEMLGVYYDAGYRNYFYLTDEKLNEEIGFHKSLRAAFKNENVTVYNYNKKRDLASVHVYSDKNPGDFYIFDRKKNSAKYLASSRPSIKPKDMASVEPFIMNARDGLKMYGQMTIPPGKELKNLPLVIYPHGGPYGAKDYWGWDNRAQMLANRGYLVIQLDYRGSGGYGEPFEKAGDQEWGYKMQDDLTDVTHWAINQGYADKDRVCIHGVSYGGYASMQAVVKEPDLYKCSIPDAGIYDVELQWKKADSFKGGRTKQKEYYMKKMMGDDYENVMPKISPAHHIDKLKAKLLLVHGHDDVRVPIENAYFLEKKLKEAGKPYETIYKKKEGHGFHKIENRIELYEKILKFLDENIGH